LERKVLSLCIKDVERLKEQLLHWGQKHSSFVMLDSNKHRELYAEYDLVCAAIAHSEIKLELYRGAFEELENYKKEVSDWIFGYLTYDLKNDVENLSSSNFDGINFPCLHFFQPKVIFLLKDNKLELKFINEDFSAEKALQEILNEKCELNIKENRLNIQPRIPKNSYIDKVESIRHHIKIGDIYEANFCQEFYSENAIIDPVKKYLDLNSISTPPFASFYKLDDKYLISASPERFIRKKGNKIVSQPIKGTAKRGKNFEEDQKIKEELRSNIKERAENIMIVDLVRNDLTKTAKRGSVKVEELCEIYTFQQVHQMISTISSEIDDNTSAISVIKNAFPMGSMTGAPKIRAMQLIELYESTKRGLYSGAVGYIDEKGNFDFNVIIRSILYNENKNYLSFTVGSAITYKSDAEQEYDETLLKANAMFKILSND